MRAQLISLLVCGQLDKVLSKHHKHEMIRYLFNHQVSSPPPPPHSHDSPRAWGAFAALHLQCQPCDCCVAVLAPAHVPCVCMAQNDDGGWGVHIEGHSTMFGSVLSYVSLRILGVPLDNPLVVHGRRWILEHGSATHITSWGKFWLSVRPKNKLCNALGGILTQRTAWFQ